MSSGSPSARCLIYVLFTGLSPKPITVWSSPLSPPSPLPSAEACDASPLPLHPCVSPHSHALTSPPALPRGSPSFPYQTLSPPAPSLTPPLPDSDVAHIIPSFHPFQRRISSYIFTPAPSAFLVYVWPPQLSLLFVCVDHLSASFTATTVKDGRQLRFASLSSAREKPFCNRLLYVLMSRDLLGLLVYMILVGIVCVRPTVLFIYKCIFYVYSVNK